MRIPGNHNDKHSLKLWQRKDKKVQKSFEVQLEASVNKRKLDIEKQLKKNILDTLI